MNRVFARPYASALFELALEQDQLEQTLEATAALGAAAANKGVSDLLKQPGVPKDMLIGLLEELCAHALTDLSRKFIKILAQSGRLFALAEIHQIYSEMLYSHTKVRTALVRSAHPLSETELQEIKTKLSARFNKEIKMEVTVEPALIGGIVIESENEVIDGSVLGRLNRLNQALVEVC